MRGFRLAGVSGQAVVSAAEAACALKAAAAGDCAILIVTETVADSIRPLVEQVRFEWPHPLIVEIPGPEGPLPGRKSLRQLAEEAVGIHLDAEKGS